MAAGDGIKNGLPSAGTSASAAGARCQVRCNLEAGAPRRFDKVEMHGLDFLQEFLVDDKIDAPVGEHAVFFSRLVQSQPQGGAASAGLEEDPDGVGIILLFQEFRDHVAGLLGNFNHNVSLILLFDLPFFLFVFSARFCPAGKDCYFYLHKICRCRMEYPDSIHRRHGFFLSVFSAPCKVFWQEPAALTNGIGDP
jgi:hypothetical protein